MTNHVVKKNVGDTIHQQTPPDKWTSGDFMQVAGLSRSTLLKLRREGVVNPESMQIGQITVYLYDDPDLDAVKDYKRNSSRRWVGDRRRAS